MRRWTGFIQFYVRMALIASGVALSALGFAAGQGQSTASPTTGASASVSPLMDLAIGSETSRSAPDQTAPCPDPSAIDGQDAFVAVDFIHRTVTAVPARNVVLPNQGLEVVVCHLPQQKIDVDWAGTRGLTSASTNDETQALQQARVKSLSVSSSATTVIPEISRVSFAPRQSGAADLTISSSGAGSSSSSSAGGSSSQSSMTIELQVDTLYWGAIRVGVGTLFGVSDRWQTFSIGTFAGSQQPEIGRARDEVAFEAVSGFAPYLLDVLACGGHGRSYTGGCNYRFAPFVGFGVLGAGTSGNQGVQALTSFHAGLEFEFAQSFSIAFDFVMRRTRALNTGYEIGSPVLSSMSIQDVTHSAWYPGLGVVVNATPNFLQFPLGSSSSSQAGSAGGAGTSQSSQGGH